MNILKQFIEPETCLPRGKPTREFISTDVIHSVDDWSSGIPKDYRHINALFACLPPSYFASHCCRDEWHQILFHQGQKKALLRQTDGVFRSCMRGHKISETALSEYRSTAQAPLKLFVSYATSGGSKGKIGDAKAALCNWNAADAILTLAVSFGMYKATENRVRCWENVKTQLLPKLRP